MKNISLEELEYLVSKMPNLKAYKEDYYEGEKLCCRGVESEDEFYVDLQSHCNYPIGTPEGERADFVCEMLAGAKGYMLELIEEVKRLKTLNYKKLWIQPKLKREICVFGGKTWPAGTPIVPTDDNLTDELRSYVLPDYTKVMLFESDVEESE